MRDGRGAAGFGIICNMEKTRPILYGVADYAELRKKNGWFIDRTAKIRDLEATHYAKAIDQLDRYSSDPAPAASWRIGSGVALHRLVLVFHGGDCALDEEV